MLICSGPRVLPRRLAPSGNSFDGVDGFDAPPRANSSCTGDFAFNPRRRCTKSAVGHKPGNRRTDEVLARSAVRDEAQNVVSTDHFLSNRLGLYSLYW